VGARDDRDVRAAKRFGGVVVQHLLQVRKLRPHVLEVRAGQVRRSDDRVVDAHVEPLADQDLGESHVRALAQVVGQMLEGEAEHRHPPVVAAVRVDGRENPFRQLVDEHVVGRHRPAEDGQVDAVHPGQVQQAPHVLR
jgi:hypothetical protein